MYDDGFYAANPKRNDNIDDDDDDDE